jgi:hypothetical protein
MNKNIVIGVIVVVVIITGVLVMTKSKGGGANISKGDYKNATYMIDGKPVKLVLGVSEVSATPGSASKIITKYFGNDVKLDFNDDGREDVAFIII